MSVPVQTPSKEYIANGTTTAFPLNFNCDKSEYLIVTLNGEEAPVGSWTLSNDTVTFTLAPANDVVVNLQRNTPFQRTTNYQLYDNSFRPSAVNKDFDLIWWKLQELGYRDQVIWLALVKEISDRIDGDENLQNQINTIDNWLTNLQQNVNENTNDIAQLINDLSKEIADRITGDQILKDMFISMIDEAINEGTINALAITHLDSLEALEGVTNVWDGRTIYIKDLGNYRYDALTTSWVKAYQDAVNVKDGAENQKEINNKTIQEIESINDLINITPRKVGQVVYVKSYHSGKNAGGGQFIYKSTLSTFNDGIIVFNGWARVWDSLNIQPEWAGAIEGQDSTVALQKILDFISPTAFDTSVAVMNLKKGGLTLELPATKLGYIVSDTLWIGAGTRIVGSGKMSFMTPSDTVCSKLIANFSDPLKPLMSSSNWKTGGVRVAYDEKTSGQQYDDGLISHTPDLNLTGFNLFTANGTRAFMGLRIQNSPRSNINVSTYGFDYGIMLNACWTSNIDSFSLSHKSGLLADFDNNNCKFDGYYNNDPSNIPLVATNLIDFYTPDTDTDNTLNNSSTTFGFVSRYSYGSSSNNMTCEGNDVGASVCQGALVFNSLYTEKSKKYGYVGFSNQSKVIISLHSGAFDENVYCLGAGGKVSIGSYTKDGTAQASIIKKISVYNTLFVAPVTLNAYYPSIFYSDSSDTYYISSIGDDSNNGILDVYPLATLDEAFKRITDKAIFSNRGTSNGSKKSRIVFMSSGSFTLNNNYILNNDVEIYAVNDSTTPNLNINGRLVLENADIVIWGCNITKPNVVGDIENACFWTRYGSNTVSINGGTTNILGGGIVYCDYNGSSELTLFLNGVNTTGSSTSQLVQGNYNDTSPHIINVVRSKGTISSDIIGRPDKGISVPVSWQNKILGL